MSLPQIRVLLPKDMGHRTWGRELLVADTPHYIGKVLEMRAGEAGGCQYHHEKDETSYLLSGSAWVYTDTGDGTLSRFLMQPGTAIHIPPGAVHKVEAITDCLFFEASTPHFNDRVRVEEQYGRTDTEGLQTTRVRDAIARLNESTSRLSRVQVEDARHEKGLATTPTANYFEYLG